jgi:hypothetical protein
VVLGRVRGDGLGDMPAECPDRVPAEPRRERYDHVQPLAAGKPSLVAPGMLTCGTPQRPP